MIKSEVAREVLRRLSDPRKLNGGGLLEVKRLCKILDIDITHMPLKILIKRLEDIANKGVLDENPK